MEEQIYQVLSVDRNGITVCQSWHESEEEAKDKLADCKKFWPHDEWWIEAGTDYITNKCRHCGTVHATERYDAYSLYTGIWCGDCYDSSNYPYRKDKYDYEGAGERLDDDY